MELRLLKLFGGKTHSIEDAQIISGLLLEKMRGVAQEKKADFLVVISPFKGHFLQKSESYYWFENYLRDHHFNFIDYRFVIQTSGLEIEPLYVDGYHFSAAGNLLLAQTISKRSKILRYDKINN